MAPAKEVDMFAVRIALELGRSRGILPTRLLAELPFDLAATAKRGLAVRWDDYVEVCDRLRDDLGGNEAMSAAASDLPEITPHISNFAALFVSPQRLCEFFARVLDPRYWPCIHVTWERLGPGLFRTESQIPQHFRSGEAVFAAGEGAWRTTPCRLGLPPAELLESRIGSHRGTYVLRLPPSRTIPERIRQRAGMAFAHFAADEMALDASAISAGYSRWANHASDEVATAAERWGFTPRERDVLHQIVRGLSNKDIARNLGLSPRTVEVHVANMMRKSKTNSRAALTARVTQRWPSSQ